MASRVIPVLLSRQAMAARPRRLTREPTPVLEEIGVTYSMAQEARWIDDDSFAIGRWDGTLTLFGLPAAHGAGPRIESAAVSPAWAGLEMITPLNGSRFVTSNDESSMVVWDASEPGAVAIQLGTVRYDREIGVANSGALMRGFPRPVLVTGHASGWLMIWQADDAVQDFALLRRVDLRSPDPVPSPYSLRNVRAVHEWRDGLVLTGAEDGDLCLVDVTDGHILCRRRYNPDARRGINDVALLGDTALVGGCSVGSADSNTWAFSLDLAAGLTPLAHIDLVADSSREQVFNFSVELARAGDGLLFFCATEEGLLWVGELTGSVLRTLGKQAVSSGLGAAVSLQPDGDILAVVGDNVHLFRVRDTTRKPSF